jgi:hypothetical protein
MFGRFLRLRMSNEPGMPHVEHSVPHVEHSVTHVWNTLYHIWNTLCHMWNTLCHMWNTLCHMWNTLCHMWNTLCHMWNTLCHTCTSEGFRSTVHCIRYNMCSILIFKSVILLKLPIREFFFYKNWTVYFSLSI